jgi:hypothetical protein
MNSHPTSQLVFNPTTTPELEQLMRELEPFLHNTRGDSLERREITENEGETVTLYVILRTGNLEGMLADLREANVI